MSGAWYMIAVELTAEEGLDFEAAARADRTSPPALAAELVRAYLGPRRVQVGRDRHEAARRFAILRQWWAARRGAAVLGFRERQTTAQFLARLATRRNGVRLSKSTLYGWERRWRQGGVAALVDGRHEATARERDDRLIRELERLYRTGRRPTLADCYRQAAATATRRGWRVVSYATATRHMERRHEPRKGASKPRR